MYTDISQITVEDLKKKCTLIHYFGLGFIQIKLGVTHRLHIYTDLLPRITDEEEVHNHRYDFVSVILHGTLHQELFIIQEGLTHLLEEETCKENHIPDKTKIKPCCIEKIYEETLCEGGSYYIPHTTFHRVTSANAITFLTRSNYKKELAEVVRPRNGTKVCPFSKKIQEEELWSIVSSVLEKAKGWK
jgi:hypothetical protein